MLLSIFLIAGVFLIASYFDLKERLIEDKLWIIGGVLALAVNSFEALAGRLRFGIFEAVISIAITSAIGWALYYLRFYGGADAKALVVASIAMPVYRPPYYFHPIAPLMILTNTFFAALSVPVVLGIYNFYNLLRGRRIFEGFEHERQWRKIFACFLGFRLRSEKAPKFLLGMEKTVEGRRTFEFSRLKDEEEFITEHGKWVTPGLPLIVFMTVGYAVMLVFGDLLLLIYGNFL